MDNSAFKIIENTNALILKGEHIKIINELAQPLIDYLKQYHNKYTNILVKQNEVSIITEIGNIPI